MIGIKSRDDLAHTNYVNLNEVKNNEKPYTLNHQCLLVPNQPHFYKSKA